MNVALVPAEHGWHVLCASPDTDELAGVAIDRWPVVAWALHEDVVRAVAVTPEGPQLVTDQTRGFVALINPGRAWESREDVDARMRDVIRGGPESSS